MAFPGLFNSPVAIETYAKVFEEEGALDKLEAFASLNGPKHYRLPPNEETITLEKLVLDRAGGGQGRRARTRRRWSIAAAKPSSGRLCLAEFSACHARKSRHPVAVQSG